MITKRPLTAASLERVGTLGQALERCSGVVFAYVFGGAAVGRTTPLSDVDVAVYVDDHVDPAVARLEVIGVVTSHLRTDEVDVVVLNRAPTALAGRILQTRRVVLDRDPHRRHLFESLALRSFADFRVYEHRLLARRYGHG